jgi:hypothetical protein
MVKVLVDALSGAIISVLLYLWLYPQSAMPKSAHPDSWYVGLYIAVIPCGLLFGAAIGGILAMGSSRQR